MRSVLPAPVIDTPDDVAKANAPSDNPSESPATRPVVMAARRLTSVPLSGSLKNACGAIAKPFGLSARTNSALIVSPATASPLRSIRGLSLVALMTTLLIKGCELAP